jgi:hypothetical protein
MDFFSFSGEIQNIELERDGGGSQVAYVTFKESQALDTALLLSVSLYHLAKRNFLICIPPQLYSKVFTIGQSTDMAPLI